MAVTYRNGGRANLGAARTITSTAGGGVVNYSGTTFPGQALGRADPTSAVGSVFEILGDTINPSNNVKGYVCVAAAPGIVTLRPAPVAGSVDGTLQQINAENGRIFAGVAVTSITLIPGADNFAVIEAAAGVFISDTAINNRPQPGDFVTLYGDIGTATNNGGYYVVAILSDTQLVVIPPDAGPGLSTITSGATIVVRRTALGFEVVDERTWGKMTGAPALTFTTSTISRLDGLSWEADGFNVGDSLIIQQSSSNDVLDSAASGYTVASFSNSLGTSDVLHVTGTPLVADIAEVGVYVETAGVTWRYLRDNATPLAGPAGAAMGPVRAGAVPDIHDFIHLDHSPAATPIYTVRGIGVVAFRTAGLSQRTHFRSEEEIVIYGRTGGTGGLGDSGGSVCDIAHPSTVDPGIQFRIGANYAAGPRTATRGANWHGFQFDMNSAGLPKALSEVYGSFFNSQADIVGDGGFKTFGDFKSIASMFRKGLDTVGAQAGSAQDVQLTSVILYDGFAWRSIATTSKYRNVILPSQEQTIIFAGSAALTELALGEFAFSSSSTVQVIDPFDDPDVNLLAPNGGAISKHYTYNPIHVFSDAGLDAPDPATGVNVQITQIDVNNTALQTVVHDGPVDSTGRLANGAGVLLLRQTVSTNYRHRVVITGPGISLFDATITMREPMAHDRIIPLLQARFGEPPEVEVLTSALDVDLRTPTLGIDVITGAITVEKV